jgi:NADH-quinone oxidoreductase subunit F
MGSGGMIVVDERTCMVDLARYYMGFLKGESCGKCFPCRKGTQRMYEILEDICGGKGTPAHLDLLEELARVVKDTTLCGLGQTAPNPVLSTLRYFRNEYLEHIENLRCPAGVCKDLVGAPCQSACPLGTEAWRYVAHIQRGEYEDAYRVIREANPFPSVCARVCHHPCEERCRLGSSGSQPLAIRALKRFITDRVDPSAYRPDRDIKSGFEDLSVAVVGAGPAGLTAAHLLSLQGYQVSVYEAAAEPGGMLMGAIPAYRLPKEILRREIDSLLNENITLHTRKALGRDFTIDSLFASGVKAVFLSTGAWESKELDLGQDGLQGVYEALPFLQAANLEGKALARGKVVVIGGGNAAVDAARIARRQRGVESVTILYRRSREQMPAFAEEVEAAIQEGVRIEPFVSPLRIVSQEGRAGGLVCLKTRPGEREMSGRRKPVLVPGSEHTVPLDTLIIAVGEVPERKGLSSPQIEMTEQGTIRVDPVTLETGRPGVFAGGDVATGPNTVVEAIAAGKRAALMIDRYLRGGKMKQPGNLQVPRIFLEPLSSATPDPLQSRRVKIPLLPAESRVQSFAEVEKCLSAEEAGMEAKRCLRCDLEFTRAKSLEGEKGEGKGIS